MKNRSTTVLAILAANDQLGQSAVRRTVLVKQVFLADTIRPLYRVWIRAFSFVRYYYGPFSDDIFESLDTLIFNGLVEVTAFERRAGKSEARYKITPVGHEILKQIGAPEIVALSTDLVWALQCLGVEQAGTICKLVYEEAEFSRIFSQHNQQGIGAETRVPLPSVTNADNETFIALAALQELRKLPGTNRRPAPPVKSREIVRLFLQSLAMHFHLEHKHGGVAA